MLNPQRGTTVQGLGVLKSVTKTQVSQLFLIFMFFMKLTNIQVLIKNNECRQNTGGHDSFVNIIKNAGMAGNFFSKCWRGKSSFYLNSLQ